VTTGAGLLRLRPEAGREEVTAALGAGEPPGRLLTDVSRPATQFGLLALDVPTGPVVAPSLGYRPAGPRHRSTGPDVGEGTTFVIANNVADGRDDEFDRWYDEVHIPHTFEYFGFTAAQRYVAVDPAAPFQRLVAYASPSDVAGVEAAIAWAAEDRRRAAQEGREPALAVTSAVVGPRHAAFYRPA